METTIALYSHDSVGLGHARRNRALAFALAEQLPERLGAPTRGILIAGSPDVAQDSLPDGWDWLILPGVTAHQTGYAPRSVRASTDEVIRMRSATIQAMLTAWLPDLFIVDRHPLGVNGELLPALRRLRSTGCATVLGLRDVLDAPAAAAREWDRLGIVDQVRRHFDAIWLYGDPAVHDQRRSGAAPAGARLHRGAHRIPRLGETGRRQRRGGFPHGDRPPVCADGARRRVGRLRTRPSRRPRPASGRPRAHRRDGPADARRAGPPAARDGGSGGADPRQRPRRPRTDRVGGRGGVDVRLQHRVRGARLLRRRR